MNKSISRAENLTYLFNRFTNTEWIFETEKTRNLMNSMNAEEESIFKIDVSNIDWKSYLHDYMYGLQKYVLKENIDPPSLQNQREILTSPKKSYIKDIKFVMQHAKKPQFNRSINEYCKLILNKQKIKEAMHNFAQNKASKEGPEDHKIYEKYYKQCEKNCKDICLEMFAGFNINMIGGLCLFLRKVFKRIYDKVVIDENHIARLKALQQDKTKGPLVLLPTHRSYIDFLLISYVFFCYGIQAPRIIAGEDFLKILLLNKVLRHSGAVFIRRKMQGDPLYKLIFQEYVQQLLIDGCNLEFFVEGTRSRNGKMLSPKFGVLNMCTDLFFDKVSLFL